MFSYLYLLRLGLEDRDRDQEVPVYPSWEMPATHFEMVKFYGFSLVIINYFKGLQNWMIAFERGKDNVFRCFPLNRALTVGV